MLDAVVIGAGLSGCTAALALVAAGHKVAVASAGWGASANFCGQLTLAASPALGQARPWQGQDPGEDLATSAAAARAGVAEHVRDIARHEPLHPYATLGEHNSVAHMGAALALLAKVLQRCHVTVRPELLTGGSCTPWPAAIGALLPVWSEQAPWQQGGAGKGHVYVDFAHAGVGLLGRECKGWQHDASRFALSLPRFSVLQPKAVLLQHGGVVPSGVFSLARAFDDVAFRTSFASYLRDACAGAAAVWLPPVAGVKDAGATLAALSDGAGMPVRETLASVPAVPGARLVQALEAALQAAGVVRLPAVTGRQIEAGVLRALHFADGQEVRPRTCVLATGRFVGGGMGWQVGQRCRETALDLAVSTDGGPITERSAMELTRRRPEDDQPLLRAGVATDARLRPYTDAGRPLHNVWAAGDVLGGFSAARSHCSDGVALTTGHAVAQDIVATLTGKAAGRAAAGEAR